METVTSHTEAWYSAYYAHLGASRNDRLNPEVVFQDFATEEAIRRALRRVDLDRPNAKILDVGCGMGSSLSRFLALGMRPENLFGIDILAERIDKTPYQGMNLSVGDAQSMTYPDGKFDLVMESTMFVQITDESLATRIADEMLRVTRPGGHILICDWRYGRPGKSDAYRAVGNSRIHRLFRVDSECDFVSSYSGALVPPIGRRLSRWAPSTYFLFRRIFPPMVGLTVTLLRRGQPANQR